MATSVEMLQRNEEIPLRSTDQIRMIFNRYDLNHDGVINLAEFRQLIESREHQRDLPDHVIQLIFQKADRDINGTLNYDEFYNMMRNPENQYLFQHLFFRYVKSIIPRQKPRTDRPEQTEVDGDYEDEYTCCPPPIGMLLISLIILVIFIIDETQKQKTLDGPIATLFVYDPQRRKEVWRYVTYMFVHVGFFHLIVNLAVQLMLGIPLEMVHRWWRVLIVYLLGVLAGSLATSVADPTVKLAGASGGVYSLITAHIASIIINWKEMSTSILQLIIFLIIAIADVGQAIYNRYVLDINEHIGYAAHFAGALTGLLAGFFILRNLEQSKMEKIIKYTAITIFVTLISICIVWNAVYDSYFPKQVV